MTFTKTVFATTGLCLLLSLGCGGPRESAEVGGPEATGAGDAWRPTGNEGTIAGKVNFSGDVPKYRPLSMDADPACAAKHSGPVYPDTVLRNANGTLRNVFIYVKSGLDGKTFEVPAQAVVLDQVGCIYQPRVLGIQANQELRVVTSDNTTHNIHPTPKVNRAWNVSQAPGADPIVQRFSRPEVSIPVKCNQHPWMRAYVHVLSHPFYAVTGEDGTFKLEGLPPGEYEIEALHEEYGALTQTVAVGPDESKSLDFDYRSTQAYRPGSLEVMPAVALHCCAGN